VWCAAAWPAVVCLVPLSRCAARRLCRARPGWGFPTLVIGSGDAADRLARLLMRSPGCGLRPVLLTDPDGLCRASIVPVMNDAQVLRSIVRARGIRHAVLAAPDVPAAKLARLFDRYGELASHLLVVCDAPPMPALWGAQRVCGLGGVEVRNGLLLAPLRVAKRVTDVGLAGASLILGMPLLLAIAAAVKLGSKGPVLYGHTRIGRYGRKFTAWKFRTMYRGADLLLRQHLERFPAARLEWERDQKLRDDPRVTRVGRVLRRLSLDELPQVWNVLRGEMSLVGPRPIVDDEVGKYGEAFALYTVVKPGITGLWQVSGRTDVGYEMRVKLDEFYVRHWSPWLDAYVLVRTVVALVKRRGAY
jgi:Undecaprenyl-phosphate galactose phosphotransferase WbaP